MTLTNGARKNTGVSAYKRSVYRERKSKTRMEQNQEKIYMIAITLFFALTFLCGMFTMQALGASML